MKNLRNYLSYVPKPVVAVAAMAVLSLSSAVGPLALTDTATAGESPVRMEADTKIANVTQGDEEYHDSVEAKVDDVVKVQLWYHNMEDWDSGKTADNLRAQIDIPKSQGEQQTINSSLSADNELDWSEASNFETEANLSMEHAFLEYIEGSAKWRHNQGAAEGRDECITKHEPVPEDDPNDCYTTESISDDIVSEGGVHIEDEYQPSFEYQSTITVEARVKSDAVAINKYVRNLEHDNTDDWETADWEVKNEAEPGDELQYMIRFENRGNTDLHNVVVGDNLPDYMSFVDDSTTIVNGHHPDGVDAETDNVYQGGIDVGHYAPGAAGYVIFNTEIDESNVFAECGTYTLKNVGIVRPEGMNEFYNTAHTDVDIDCPEPEVEKMVECVDLSASEVSGQPGLEVDFEAEFEAENLEVEGFTIDYGDGATEQVTGTGASHVYEDSGQYQARVSQAITDHGAYDVDTDACAVDIAVTEPEKPADEPEVEKPDELAEAGFGGPLLALFGSGAIGAAIRSWLQSRRGLHEQLLG